MYNWNMLDVPTRCSWLSLTLPQLQGLVDVVPGYLTTSFALSTGHFYILQLADSGEPQKNQI